MSDATLQIAGNTFRVFALNGRFALSEPFLLDVHAAHADAPAAADVLGQPFELTLTDGYEQALSVRGVVMAVERRVVYQDGATYHLSLEPDVAPLRVGMDNRVFQEMSVVDIVKDVLQRGGVSTDKTSWLVDSAYPIRPYCAQYGESDWQFVERLLAEEGIYYTFDCTDSATILVFADDSTAAADLPGGAEIPFTDPGALRSTRDAVSSLSRKLTRVSDAVRLRDYNFEKPSLLLEGTAKEGDGKFERYDYPGRFKTPDHGNRLSKRQLEALRARKDEIRGQAATTRLRAGFVMELAGHPAEIMNARYLVTSVTFHLEAGRDAGTAGLSVGFTAIPVDTMFRAVRAEKTRSPTGLQTGQVVGAPGEEIFTEKTGRVRVQFYWDREGKKDDTASTWMRVGQFALGGSMILPRVGWDVMASHHEGDIDEPYVAGHLYDGQHPVPYPLPANKTRTAWQTGTTPGDGTSGELRFEDKGGSEELFLHAAKDMNVVVGDGSLDKVGVNLTEDIGANRKIKVGSNLSLNVGADQSVRIGASETLSISGSRQTIVTGSETATIGGSRTMTATGGASLDAKAGRTLTVGGSMIEASALACSRAVLGSLSVSIGGAWVQAAALGLSDMTAGACAETVGGAKLAIGASGCDVTVAGAAAETVGGAYVIAAGGNAGEDATGPLVINVGGAFLANAPTIDVKADSEISIRCGGSSIKITAGSIEIKSPLVASPGATVAKDGSTIKRN